MITYEQLLKYLNENNADYSEINQPLFGDKKGLSNAVFDISIEWGDWKHSWAYLRRLMEQIGYIEINHKITEENGSDCRSGISRFVLKTLWKIK